MEEKICKWSKILKWLIILALIWYVIGLCQSVPQIFLAEEWTQEYATQDIMQQLQQYIDIDQSSITLQSGIENIYLLEKKYYIIKRFAEIICNMLIFIFGLLVTRRLSKQVIFDDAIWRLAKWSGLTICISSIVIPTLGHIDTGITLLGGTGFDISVDFYRLGCGIAFILLAYVLRYGQFLQEEYNTTL